MSGNFTEEDIQYLKKFESNFNTSIKANYTRNIPRKDVENMVEIYNRVNGKALKLCSYCSSSVLSFLKDIGQQYFNAVQKGFEQQLKTIELEKEVAYSEDNTKECTTTNTKNKKITKKINAKYTTK